MRCGRLMPIRRHFADCKVLLFMRLTYGNSAIYHLPEQTSLKTRSSCMHYVLRLTFFSNLPNLFIIPYPHLCFIILLFCISAVAFICLFYQLLCEFYCLHIQLQLFVTAIHNKRMYMSNHFVTL